MNALGKLFCLRKVGQLALHPDEVGVRGVSASPVNGALAAALVAVKALARAGRIPIELNVGTGETLCNGAGLGVGLALGLLQELGDQALLVDVDTGVDGVNHGLVEELEASLSVPLVLDGLQLGAKLAGRLGRNHEVVERLQSGVGGALNEGVVTRVDGAGDERSGL